MSRARLALALWSRPRRSRRVSRDLRAGVGGVRLVVILVVVVLWSLCAALFATAVGATPLRPSLTLAGAVATPGWGTAEEVPGIATLDAGGGAWVNSLSCASAGNCAAGGFYGVGYDHTLAFVVDEVNGTWGNAQEVPGLGALTASGFAAVVSLSCASAGNCAAGGYYEDSSYLYHPFVVDEVNGTWGSAEEVSGLGALNDGGSVATTGPPLVSLSCASAGNCAAGGHYTDGVDQPAFVVDEVNGTWGPAEKVRGLDLLGGCQRMSTRSRAPPRATARPAGTTGTGDRRSWSTRSTALGAAPSRSPAWRR